MAETAQSVIENRIAEICIDVKDYPRAERFYKDFLGLPLAWGNGECIGYFDMQGVGILVVQTDQPKTNTECFSIAAKDIDAAYAFMSRAGVAVSEIATYGNGQRAFTIADPEGNRIGIIKYPDKN